MDGFQHLSGITIKRLEKPKPKPESQPNTQTTEVENSFENEDDESSEEYYEEEEEEEDYDEEEEENGSKSTVDMSEINFRRNLNDSVTFHNKQINSTEVQNLNRSLGDVPKIQKPAVNKRVLDTTEVQNFAQNLSESTIDRFLAVKNDVQNFRQNLGNAITIDRPVNKDFTEPRNLGDSINITKAIGKRIIDTNELQNFKRNIPDAGTIGKRVIDVSEAHNFTRNIADSTKVDNVSNKNSSHFPESRNDPFNIEKVSGNKRVLNVQDLHNFKQNFNDSVTFNRPTVTNKRVLDTSEVHSIKRNLDESVTIARGAPRQLVIDSSEVPKIKQNLNELGLDRTAISSSKEQYYGGAQNLQKNLNHPVVPDKEFIDKHADFSDTENEDDFVESDITSDSGEEQDEFKTKPENISSGATEQTSNVIHTLDTNQALALKQRLDNSITLERSSSSKNVLTTSEIRNFRKGANEFRTGTISDITTVKDAPPLQRPHSSKRVLDTAEIQSIEKGMGNINTQQPTIAKRILSTTDLQNFGLGIDDSVKLAAGTPPKRVLDTSELQNLKQSLTERQTPNRRILNTNKLQGFNRGFDYSNTFKQRSFDNSEEQQINDSVTFERPTMTKRVLDTTELQNLKRNLDNSVTIARPSTAKRVLDTTQLQNLRNLDSSVTLERQLFNRHSEVTTTNRVSSEFTEEPTVPYKKIDDSGNTKEQQLFGNVIDSNELQNIRQVLGEPPKTETSTSKQVLDSTVVYNYKRSLEDSVTIDRTGAKRISNQERYEQSLEETQVVPQDLDCTAATESDSKINESITLSNPTEIGSHKTVQDESSNGVVNDIINDNLEIAKLTELNEVTGFQNEFERSYGTADLKRSLDSTSPESASKKLKMNQSETSLEKLKSPLVPSVNTSLSDAPTDEEISEYGSASDLDSESELDSEIAAIKREAAASFNKEIKIEPADPSFLENLVAEPFIDKAVADIPIKTEVDGGDTNDYDYDIKEKLKEMGEISFETVKKGDKPKKGDGDNESAGIKKSVEDDVVIERKGPGGGVISSMMRRNIREVMDETKLDESTLAAQREEMERLQRVQEQQRLIREVQRQMAQERMQNKVLSLLQGGNLSKTGSSGTRIGNTVLVKLPNGETKSVTKVPKQQFDLVKLPKGPLQRSPQGSNFATIKKSSSSSSGPGQLTPSVSIAPVSKKSLPPSRPFSDSEGEYEDPRMQRMYPKGKPPKPSTLTTTEGTSDDDCIVVSDSEADQSLEDEIIEDPSNSGLHTNDEFNQPDDQGRVVVNIGHTDGEPDIYLAPQIARIIKPHQVGGVRFLYDNVIESINRFDSSTGFGCILAHSMGLGKTLQVVSFSDIFLRHTSAKTILCIMPINTLQNWLAEYNMWLPAEEEAADNPLNAQGEVRPRIFSLYVLNDSHKTLTSRSRVVQAWRSSGGVLLIGYEQYRLLSLRKQPKSRRKPHLVQPEDEDKNRKLLDDIHGALVMPGPDLVICDEGHRIKNSHASISQALKQMRTKRRVVLTGYPLQNNLMEYWCMVDFVRPNYLGTKAEFCNMFERPIQNGQCMDSTEADIKLMRYRAHVLHSLLVGFVQRRSHEVLQNALPQKEEYVLLLRMTDFQRKLYNVFMNEVVRCQSVPNPLKAFAVCCKIWNHPDVLYNFLKKRAGGEAVDIDLEEVSNTSSTLVNTPVAKAKRTPRRSVTPKGRRSVKPAASVTPNNTREEEKPPPRTRRSGNFISPNPVPDSSEFFHNENANFPSLSVNNQQNSSTFGSQTSEANTQSTFANQSFSQNFSNFSSNTSQASTSNTFQNIKQQLNLWEQKDQTSNLTSTNSHEAPWHMDKPGFSNIITSPLKNELSNSYGSVESKPKINIISDIKLGSPFQNPLGKTTTENKKINIISDIKLEVKKEESGDDKRFPRFNMDGLKNEIKPLMKPSEAPPRRISEDDDVKIISEMPPPSKMRGDDGQDGIPYDWAIELLKDYIPGCIEYSAKTEVLFCIIRESIALGDRLLLFSQSLITLDVIEQFLQTNNVPGDTEKWAKNVNYYRLDGSTSALEREKLINEFNSNPKIHLFLVSTRAGSLGINLVGANRVVVFDASWNPCHDTQAVCRVYRYGQRKPCFVYRFVMDHCLEKKIYDRQINKQGMSDRVVDECNPDSHVTMKDLSTLCFDDSDEGEVKDWSCVKDNYVDTVLQKVLEKYGSCFSKQPFQHESLLVDRKDKQLSQQEKRLAKKGYEREKQASRQPSYNLGTGARSHRPVASVRPMLQGGERPSRWIPAEHWQRQGMTAQEMTLPLDVVIPTNQPDKSNIILKAGQKVLVLKSPKGVYMQLENGKIVAIKTAMKVRGKAEEDAAKIMKPSFPSMKPPPPPLPPPSMPLLPPKRMVRPFAPGHAKMNMRSMRQPVPNLVARMQGAPRMQSPSRKLLSNRPPFPITSEAPRSETLSKLETESKKIPLSSDLSQRLMGDEITMEKFPNKNEKKLQMKVDLPQQAALLKSIQQRGAISISSPKPRNSTLQQLEQSTSALITETKQRIQDINDITNSYHEDEKAASISDSSSAAHIESDDMQDTEDVEDIEDLDGSFEDEELNESGIAESNTDDAEGKGEDLQNSEYNYNGYYGYNQPYSHPPHQGYGGYPPHQAPPYDYTYGQPQQPPYNYGLYPQGYHPPQHQYPMPPPQPYDPYAPHPPQPLYGGYAPFPQQYPHPPTPYPPAGPPPPPNYPDYQYNTQTASQNQSQSSNSSYYQNT